MSCKPFGTQLVFLFFPFLLLSAVIMKETEKSLGKRKKRNHCKFDISLQVVRAPLKTGGALTAKFTPKAAELDSAPYTTAWAAFAGKIHPLRRITSSIVKHSIAKGTKQMLKKNYY